MMKIIVLLPLVNEVWGKVMFLFPSVILLTGGLPTVKVCIRRVSRSAFRGQGVYLQRGLHPEGGLLRGGGWAYPFPMVCQQWSLHPEGGVGPYASYWIHALLWDMINNWAVSLLTKSSFQFLKIGIRVKLLDGYIHVLIWKQISKFHHLVDASNLLTLEDLMKNNTWRLKWEEWIIYPLMQ